MPELPEVQTVVDNLCQLKISGRTISAAEVHWPRTIAQMTPEEFCRTIRGCIVQRISRRAKYIVFQLSGDLSLLIHLRMTGRLNWLPADAPRNAHEHVVLEVDGAHTLRFQDTRKFGRIWLTGAPEQILGPLGPEPLDAGFTAERFAVMLKAHNRRIKPLLLDQHFLAGLGNIYVDEALWTAGIHPQRCGASLTGRQARALHRAIRQVLQTGIENLGTSLGTGKGNFYSVGSRPGRNATELKVFRRTGQPCPRCRTAIERIQVAQRSTHLCPCCQKA